MHNDHAGHSNPKNVAKSSEPIRHQKHCSEESGWLLSRVSVEPDQEVDESTLEADLHDKQRSIGQQFGGEVGANSVHAIVDLS